MRLKGKSILIFLEEGFDDLEFWVTYMRLIEEGAKVVTAGTGSKDVYTGVHSLTAKPDTTIDKVEADQFDAVVNVGGWCADKLRRYEKVKSIVRKMYQDKKIIATICHGGWVPVSADIVRGHKVTGSEGIKDDLINAGGIWVNEDAFRDGNLVWGRVVVDLPAFCRVLVKAIEEG